MLRKRRERLNGGRSASIVENSAEHGVMSASDAKKAMLEKWTNNERSPAAHMSLMEAARPLRKTEVKKLPGLQLLRAYPALGLNDIVSPIVTNYYSPKKSLMFCKISCAYVTLYFISAPCRISGDSRNQL